MMQLKKYFLHLLEPQILAALVILLAISIILTMVFSQKVPEFKQKYRGKFYTYLFSVVFVYAIIAFLGYNKLFLNNNLYEFIFYQFCSLIIGIFHCLMYRTYFSKFGTKNTINEYLFALITIMYSALPFVLIFTFLNGVDFTFLMLGHYLVFFVSTFLNDTFNKAMAIPPKIYKTWQFPVNYKELAGVSDEEMRDLVVFTFLMDKDRHAKKYSAYRAKGPTRVDFGRLFYNFVIDYNEKHTEDQIEIEGSTGLYSWVFFLQPKWYEATKYIDPNYTLYMNGIEENSVIFCMRTNDLSLPAGRTDNDAPDFEYDKEKDDKRVEQNDQKEDDHAETIG
ncbi:TssN family type VI secretion system protein [Chryseobacterium wangxinyae]|uniref:TssN family type VI secretion system protein n=1 Tax=Chryseobacterium sp. CY350 TaxID=2997336 RepID=UPI002271EA1F|nr:TssN family type VI secretion system protein [Chryseobacterium sp. CY350]MCY0977811.1 TssN family type VI secretion system protein [Chryseobacterium sp. CY350]WBZ94899.1 TssN family type VI secretion system protein [Chryseobacterium sp. CY350]